MEPDPVDPQRRAKKWAPPEPHATVPAYEAGDPVAKPQPTPDGSKPIPAGDKEVEKFNVAADTGGGD